jgi:hypothetical protein
MLNSFPIAAGNLAVLKPLDAAGNTDKPISTPIS